MTGDKDGRVKQFSLNFNKDLGKIIKDYGEIGVGVIFSSSIFGDLVVFGRSRRSLALTPGNVSTWNKNKDW